MCAYKIFDLKYVKTFWFDGGADIFLNDSMHLQLNTDKQLLFEYRNKVRSLMMMLNILKLTEERQLRVSKNIISLINHEYQLERSN